MDTITAEAHQQARTMIMVRVFQVVFLLLAGLGVLMLLNLQSDQKSDAKDFAECVAYSSGPCD